MLPSSYLTFRHGIDGPNHLIEIDGLPITNGWIFPWPTVSHKQMVYPQISDPYQLIEIIFSYIQKYSIKNRWYIQMVYVRQNKTYVFQSPKKPLWFIKIPWEHGWNFLSVYIARNARRHSTPLNATRRKCSFWGMVYEIYWE